MNTPTPRTDAAWAQTFRDDEDQCRAGNAASDMRDECATLERELETEKTNRNFFIEKGATLERELAALNIERDQLRAELAAEREAVRVLAHDKVHGVADMIGGDVCRNPIASAAGTRGRPGMVMISPHTATTKPAPAASRTSRIWTGWPVGAPSAVGSVEKLYCVLAMHTGRCPKPAASNRASCATIAGSAVTSPAR